MRPETEAKTLGKKMKYGRLQKLKWYCELCQHQSNDVQSYRQHVQSDKHRLMMVHFRANSGTILHSNSAAFERTFVDVLRTRFPNREIPANIVYTQVIRDKKHVHMNSTRWESVHGFCMHLERKGTIRLRMTERGPMIRYIKPEDDADAVASAVEQLQAVRDVEAVRRRLAEAPTRIEHQDGMIESIPVEAVVKVEKKTVKADVAPLFASAARPRKREADA
jgi:DNA/RNA-binding protein KIN17